MKYLYYEAKGVKYKMPIKILDEPKQLAHIQSNLAWKILNYLKTKPDYPNQIAKALRVNEQKVYYHIRELEKNGFIEKFREEIKNGSVCKYYRVTFSAYGVELNKSVSIKLDKINLVSSFFSEFISEGVFNGYIVVGAPVSHGPYLTVSRDGYFAVHLSFLLGNLCNVPNRFSCKTDIDIKNQKLEKNNLIIFGGPISNIIASEINKEMKINYSWDKYWKIDNKINNKKYIGENVGLITKLVNPYDKSKSIILLSGLHLSGTKASTIAISEFSERILKQYIPGKEYYCVFEGLDRDSDGEIDDVRVLETVNI